MASTLTTVDRLLVFLALTNTFMNVNYYYCIPPSSAAVERPFTVFSATVNCRQNIECEITRQTCTLNCLQFHASRKNDNFAYEMVTFGA